ncbi:hypothetical protein Tco_0781123 [Tanacetum coccineum]
MLNLKFAKIYNLVAFLEKPEESDGFEGIIDFLNASSIRYALTIQALVDGKKVIVTETNMRRALQLKDAEGTECLPNATIFEELTLISAKTTAWNEFSSTMASAVICLATNQKFNFSKYIFDNMVKNLRPQKKQPRRKQRKDTEVPQPSGSTEPITDEAANAEHVPTHSNDLLFSGEDRLKLNELMELCTKLSERVLDLENTKTSQAAEITKLKERVKKLERRNKSRTLGLKRLRKVGRSTQVVSFKDEGLGAQEDASKQGRKIANLDADVEVTLVDEAQGRNDNYLMFDTGVFYEQEVEIEKAVSTAKVTTISATTTIINELTLAQTLIEIKASKPKAVTTAATTTTTVVTRPKAKGVVVQDPSEFRATTSSSQYHRLKTKLAARLQAQEQEDLTVEEKSKLFVELMDKRKKHFLKNKSFDEVQKAYDKTMGWIDSFVSMDSEVVKGGKEKDEGSVTRAEESSSKRAGTELEQERIKKQKIDDDQEEAEMKKHMEIVVDEEEIAVDAIPLATKPPIIVDWKIIKEGKMGYFQIIRADGSSRRYSSMIKMLQNIDREDLETLWKLVKAKHGNTRPEEAYERVLWGDLKVMFEPDVESEVWRNLQGYNVTVWKLFSSSGVHFVRFGDSLEAIFLSSGVEFVRF